MNLIQKSTPWLLLIVAVFFGATVVSAQTNGQPPVTSQMQLGEGTVFENPNPSQTFNPNPFTNPNQLTNPPSPITPITPVSPVSPTSPSTYSFTCNNSMNNLAELLSYATCLIGRGIIPLLFAVAIIAFIWGVIQYVINPASSTKREEGGKYMLWGIVALFVMISVWGLVAILTNTFFPGVDNSVMPTPPRLKQ